MLDAVLIVFFVIVAILFFASVTVFFEHFGLWLQCRLSGAPVPFSRFVRWKRGRLNGRTLALAHIRLRKEGIDVPLERLESVVAGGGGLLDCVFALIYARRAGLDMTWDEIAAMDSEGLNPLEEVRRVCGPEQEPGATA